VGAVVRFARKMPRRTRSCGPTESKNGGVRYLVRTPRSILFRQLLRNTTLAHREDLVMFFASLLTLHLAALLQAVPVAPRQPRDTFFVSLGGRDSWSGRIASPKANGTDGPFASLEAARAAVRARPDRAQRGALVRVRGGLWLRKESLSFLPEDGGTSSDPVVWESYPGETARLAGAVRLAGWTPVRDSSVLAKLQPAARRAVAVAQVPADVRLAHWTFDGRTIGPVPTELIWNGQVLKVAQWPDTGWATIAAVDALPAPGIQLDSEHLARWAGATDAWAVGYWFWDWAASFLQVAAFEPHAHLLQLRAKPQYGIQAGQRFAVVNLLEELNEPGEYWIDTERRLVYVWPPSDPGKSETLLSVMTDPIVDVKNTADLRFNRFRMEASRGMAVRIEGGARVELLSDTITAMGGRGIEIHEGVRHIVRDGSIEDVGDAGIWISAGDRRTLTSSQHLIERVRLTRFGRWVRTNAPAVQLFGVGSTIRGCDISEGAHSGIIVAGNDHVIESNALHHLLLETRDAGAIYLGRDWTARGNVIRGNYFYSLGPAHPWRTPLILQAVYLDDMTSGVSVTDNVFDHAQMPILIGGGRDNRIERNVMIQSNPALYIDARGRDWVKTADRPGSVWPGLVKSFSQARPDSAPYADRYPTLRKALTDSPGEPIGNLFVNNVIVGAGEIDRNGLGPLLLQETGTVRIPAPDDGPWSRARIQRLLDSLSAKGVRPHQSLPSMNQAPRS